MIFLPQKIQFKIHLYIGIEFAKNDIRIQNAVEWGSGFLEGARDEEQIAVPEEEIEVA
jgi:hypothetical protein